MARSGSGEEEEAGGEVLAASGGGSAGVAPRGTTRGTSEAVMLQPDILAREYKIMNLCIVFRLLLAWL